MHAALTMRKNITEIHTYEYDITHKKKKIDTSYVCEEFPYDA